MSKLHRLPAALPRLSVAALLTFLWVAVFVPPVSAADPDASCDGANPMPLVALDSVADGIDAVDFWYDLTPGTHVWVLQTETSQLSGSDYAHLTVYGGACANSSIVCTANTTPTTAAVCIGSGPSWARVWYQSAGAGGRIEYVLAHVVV